MSDSTSSRYISRILSTAAIGLIAPVVSANIFMTEIVDATLPGAAPKFIEITNGSGSDYTFGTGGGIIVLSNASTDFSVDVDMTGITIGSGQTITVSTNSGTQDVTFQNVYGSAPDYLSGGAAFGNGDDGYALVDNGVDAASGVFLDLFGEVGIDGTGTFWEYTDGYAYRVLGLTAGNNGTFDPGNWFFSGVDALQSVNQTDEEETALILAYTTPGAYAVPEPSTYAVVLGLLAIGFVIRRRRS
ncbi:MAG: PEP-CTERM sorting domain-containing protein [Puniceicoccaceae bacterium]